MKPQYEHVTFAPGCSIRVYHRQLARIPFEWHRHPEYELTLTLNSRGRRFIGDHVAHYADDDLVLVPPNLPHTWSSNARIDRDAPEVALVIWFDGDWARRLADCCPEYAPLRSLLRRAAPGLRFDTDAARAMRARLLQLLDSSPRTRLAAALDTLADLAEAGGEPLATAHAYERADGTTRQTDAAAPKPNASTACSTRSTGTSTSRCASTRSPPPHICPNALCSACSSGISAKASAATCSGCGLRTRAGISSAPTGRSRRWLRAAAFRMPRTSIASSSRHAG